MNDKLRQVSGNPHRENPKQNGRGGGKRREARSPQLKSAIRDVVVLRENSETRPVSYGDNPALKNLMRRHILGVKK